MQNGHLEVYYLERKSHPSGGSVYLSGGGSIYLSANGGLARSLCLLARAAWIHAASTGAQTIEAPHVQAAIEQVPGAAGLLPCAATQTSV